MNTILRGFIGDYLRVVAATLFLVLVTTFLVVPYQLGFHPGEAPSCAMAPRAVCDYHLINAEAAASG